MHEPYRYVYGILMVAVLYSVTACGPSLQQDEENYSNVHGDSGIRGQDYESIIQNLNALAKQNKELMRLVPYGRSGQGRELFAIEFGFATSASPTRSLALLSEGIHGNEYTNIVDRLPETFRDLKRHNGVRSFVEKGGLIYLVPIVNPDGYNARQRENSRGSDLNRDFALTSVGNRGFTQPETIAIRDFIQRKVAEHKGTLEVSMEYHCCIGGLIHPWAHGPKPLEPDAAKRHVEVGELVTKQFGYRYGTTRDIVGYSATGGSDDYYFETYKRRAFSFEGTFGVENQNLDKHVILWNEVFAGIAKDLGGQAGGLDRPYLAVLGSDEKQMMLAVAVSEDRATSKLSLCRGAQCSSENLVELRQVKKVGGIAFYVTRTGLPLFEGRFSLTTKVQEQNGGARTWTVQMQRI